MKPDLDTRFIWSEDILWKKVLTIDKMTEMRCSNCDTNGKFRVYKGRGNEWYVNCGQCGCDFGYFKKEGF